MAEADDKVDELLQAERITYAVYYRGEKRRALDGKTSMDRWDCDFTHSSRPKEPEDFEFFTGLGLRKLSKVDERSLNRDYGPFKGDGLIQAQRRAAAKAREVIKLSKPVPPRAAEVIYCTLQDMGSECLTFEQWCAEFGYSDDSIRAEATFDACRRNGAKFRKVFGPQVIEKLREILQDY